MKFKILKFISIKIIFLIFIINHINTNISLAKDIDNLSGDNLSYDTSNSKLKFNKFSEISIVTTIKPFYNLLSAVTKGVPNCKLHLLLQGNVSPHDYSLKLKDVKMLHKANLIIWGGEQLEYFLYKLLAQPKFKNKLITITKISQLKTLTLRNNRSLDEHIWLSPYNSKIIVLAVEKYLTALDPVNSKKYIANRKKFIMKLSELDEYINHKLLLANKNNTYLVFHDAYQYFEKFYHLQAPIVISDNPAMPLSAKRMFDLHDIIIKNEVNCLFKEPQFNAKILDSLIQSSDLNPKLKIGILDPIGKDEDIGPNGYFKLMKNLADGFSNCFS